MPEAVQVTLQLLMGSAIIVAFLALAFPDTEED